MLGWVALVLSIYISNIANACYISGSDTGVCSEATIGPLGYQYRITNMPFCAKLLPYAVCVPKEQVY